MFEGRKRTVRDISKLRRATGYQQTILHPVTEWNERAYERFLWQCILGLFLLQGAATVTDTIGDTTYNGASSVNAFNGSAITPSASGTLQSIGLNVKTAAGNLQVGIYNTYSGGVFNGLLAHSGSVAAVTGWNDLPATAPLTVGTPVYIVFEGDSASLWFYYGGAGSLLYNTTTFGTWPDPSGALTSYAGPSFNMRITYTTPVSKSDTDTGSGADAMAKATRTLHESVSGSDLDSRFTRTIPEAGSGVDKL